MRKAKFAYRPFPIFIAELPMNLELKSSSEELKNHFFSLRSPQEIAALLEIDYRNLLYWIYRTSLTKRYTTFYIAKKDGGKREILAPNSNIKILQQKLNQVLQAVYKPKPSVHGFALDRSVKTNAMQHCGKKYLFSIDLKDFFPSINFGRVRGMFMGKPYFLPPKVATILAHLCCFNGHLPQGAPTSPVISNMICAQMDSQLQHLCVLNRCKYTRYADDISFSTSRKTFPAAIACSNDMEQISPGNALVEIIQKNGFSIHPRKIRLRRQDRRQEVTGVTVNFFPNLPRKFCNQIRAMLHAWKKYGLSAAQLDFETRYDRKHRSPWKRPPSFKYVVKGKIEYLGMIKGHDSLTYLRFLDELDRLDPGLAGGRGTPLNLLLRSYESLRVSDDPRGRGYSLQDLLSDTFKYFKIPVEKSFTRNNKAEQIDGAFSLNENHFIVECRWRQAVADGRQIDGLLGQVQRSGSGTRGVFFSINGWSDNVPALLKQNPDKTIILMDGDDFHGVLSGEITLDDLLKAKIKELSLKSEPFIGVKKIIKKTGLP